ncbi:cytochrome d ubiquinol oxidase subunit II [Sphingomonas sp. R86520]|uniref:cytochrome d ubiquinol oxidase subunit II n=1 Tax=Sphingomonas sp. R86520 TaxID=3093859 RepID=UPI0036D3F510
MTYSPDLATAWAFVIAFAVFGYVVMDGFDLGLGILFPLIPEGRDRDTAMNSVAPVWDGNETWLVLGGGGLLAAFPLAYAIIMSALYPPIIAMLLGLVFRGVAFEFRWRDPRHQPAWDAGFFIGSLVAALSQGIVVGALLQGIRVGGRSYVGGWWDWATPFTLLTGISVAAGYALLGSTWLIMRTEGRLQDRAYRFARALGLAFVACLALVSAATPFLKLAYWRHWFAMPGVLATAQVPLLAIIGTILLLRGLAGRRERSPFFITLALFLLSYVGLGISFFPDIIPGAVTIVEAAAPRSSLLFLLVGVCVMVPIIIAYTAWAYWVFRGKVGHEGYH